MSDLRARPRTVRIPTGPQPWLNPHRGDVISLAGAAVVVLLVFAVLLVAVREGHSDPADQNLPPLPFAGSTVNQPAGPPVGLVGLR